MSEKVRRVHHRGALALGLTLAAGAAVAVVSITPAGAATAAPASGTVYGGSSSQKMPFAVTLSPDRRRLAKAMFQVDARCADGSTFPYYAQAAFRPGAVPKTARKDVFGGQRLSRAGKFEYRGVGTRNQGALQLRATHRIQGTIRNARGSGTFRTAIVISDRSTGARRLTCSTPTVRWTAISSPGRVYAGATNRGGPVVVVLNSARRKMTAFRLGWITACRAGDVLGLGDDMTDITVGATGAFKDSLRDEETVEGGIKRTIEIALQGRAGRRQAGGTYRHVETDRNAAGNTVDVCNSGVLRWSVRSS